MTRDQIVTQLSAIFNTPYYLEQRWVGGHGPQIFAEPVNHPKGKPSFMLTTGPRGWYIAHQHEFHFGFRDIAATDALAEGRDPREIGWINPFCLLIPDNEPLLIPDKEVSNV